MLSQAVCFASITIQLLVLGILAWGVFEYIRLRHQLWNIKRRIVTMNLDEVIDELLENDDMTSRQYHAATKQTERRAGPETTTRSVSVRGEATGTATTSQQMYQQHRERLAALCAGGRARQYLGKALSVDQVDNMEDEEVEKLYGRYEEQR